ncbi:hypothetical protein BDN67DRAFT_993435 [Paxillus ammoniavirescens]|nr:hypothetical protein BDN67DRAFT_993435 [Paxillus ammoniavirescens]
MSSTPSTISRPPRPTRSIPQTPPSHLSSEPQQDTRTVLTPLRAHYLKKSLIQLQFRNELLDITNAPADNASTLSYLGPPFSPPPNRAKRLDIPFLKYIFSQFVLTFPFMASAPDDFYSAKLQPFVASIFARNLSPTILLDDSDDQESPEATRIKILAKVERNLAMFFSSGIKLTEPENVLTLTQADLDKLDSAVKKRLSKINRSKDVFDVNIVCIRTVTDKGRVRSRVHEEFIIRTRLSQNRQVCVSRRYGDFKTLVDELHKAHPDDLVPSPPAKDRTAVDVPMPSSPSLFPPLARPTSIQSDATFSRHNISSDSLSHHPSYGYGNASGGYSYGNGSSPSPPPRLSREKNRLTLRAYLHTLLATPPFSSSPVLRSFLLSGPTRLTPEEQEDARRREEADQVREEGRKRFAREVRARVDGLRDAVRSVKGEVTGRGGLTHIFATIKVSPEVRQLPENYQAIIEWARISLASTIFQTFVASDNSSETFASLKRIHGLMPYFLLKAALRIGTPIVMIRTVIDIFLAQPFGGHSLLQRMFSSSLTEEVKTLNTYIEHVSVKIDSPILCEKIRLFVSAPREIQDMYRADAKAENTHLLRVILRGAEDPVLPRALAAKVERAGSRWEQWTKDNEANGRRGMESDSDDEGSMDEEAWLFEDLKVLVKLYSRLRDREQLIALIFEGVTAELLKDIITIFYTPLAQVFRAASIADSVGDLQNFINDLIRTVEQTEDTSQSDPSSTVQAFIDLVNRHEQSFYAFVHKVHSKGSGLFENLMQWIERFLTVVREGIGASDTDAEDGQGKRITLETLLPAGGEERARIMGEVDEVMQWHYLNKIAHEEKVRRRFGRAQGGQGMDADAEDEATQALVHSVVGEINFGELVRGDADELAAEGTDEEDEDSSEYETDSDDSEEETTTDESLPETPPSPPTRLAPLTRSSSMLVPAPLVRPQIIQSVAQRQSSLSSKPLQSQLPPSPQKPPTIRQRSLSLRSSKSVTLFGKSQLHAPKDAPPVPPLPVRFDKPLPPDPTGPSSASLTGRRSTDHLPTFPAETSVGSGSTNSHIPPPPPRPPRKPRKVPVAIHPPELKHIPTLLPIFVEMMRPLLRPPP